jgi:hypothetical protein
MQIGYTTGCDFGGDDPDDADGYGTSVVTGAGTCTGFEDGDGEGSGMCDMHRVGSGFGDGEDTGDGSGSGISSAFPYHVPPQELLANLMLPAYITGLTNAKDSGD